jgi:fatty-acyl-CoA synthase
MMDYPLIVPQILRRAHQVFGEKEIVSRRADRSLHRYAYVDLYGRVCRAIGALRALGVAEGDRVATLAFNDHRHLELYFAVPSAGAVLHTVNLRLGDEQIVRVVNDASDSVMFVDASLAPRMAQLRPRLPTVRHFVVLDDGGGGAASPLAPCLDYEALLAGAEPAEPVLDLREDQAAGMCYTSGTTGDPKGVVYSHRAMFLHAMCCCMVDSLALSERETVMPVVPMFHVNAWGCPLACALTGAKQVLPGMHLQGRDLVELIAAEKVTLAAGVPTVWSLVLQALRREPSLDASSLRTVVVGGSAVPQVMVEAFDRLGIEVVHAWGMTETSPVGTVSRLKSALLSEPAEVQIRQRLKQGVPVAGVELMLEGQDGEALPWDGEAVGEVLVRGPWIATSYYSGGGADNAAAPEFRADGWFRTGDLGTVDRHGYMEITDRKKDVIKTRGEWVSSIALENAAAAVPGVQEAAVVARIDALRGEAPVLFVVRDPAAAKPVQAQEILAALAAGFEHWQVPRASDVRFVDALPKTGVGKTDKRALRSKL